MADKNPIPFGRGGRGAQLLAALQNQPRRPGQTSPPSQTPAQEPKTSDSPPSEPPKPIGRGAFLQSLLVQGRGRASPAASSPAPTPVPEQPPAFVGRGRGLALAALLSESKSKPEGPSESVRAVSPAAPSVIRAVSPAAPPLIRTVSPAISSSPATSSSPIDEPPTSELEELTIGRYKGNSGTSFQLEVNYVRLRTFKDKGIYEYHVSFDPPVDSKRMKFRLMADPAVKELTGNVKTFDGAKLYLPLKIDCSPAMVCVTMPTDNSVVTVCIKFVKKSSPADCIHLYNLLFRKVMHILKMTQVGRNYFNPKCGIPVPQHRLEIWPGYVTAVQEFEDGVMLNCDASFRVLRTVTAHDLMFDASRGKGNMKELAMKALIGCVVLTRYNNKTYKVDDISWDMNPMSSFVTHDGSSITFVDYYKRSYDIEIKDLKQPLLINKAKKKDIREGEEPKLVCLIPELCFMTGLTDEMRNDFKVMKDVAVHTRVLPEARQLCLQKYVDSVRQNEEAHRCFTSWNVELDARPLSLEGRLLDREILYFGNNRTQQANPEADWGRAATSNPVLKSQPLQKWCIICPRRDAPKVREFTKMLRSVCPGMGMQFAEPEHVEIMNDRTETYCEAIRDLLNPSVQMVVAIFPTPRDDRYAAFKKLCCVERPVPSQAINLKTISDMRKLRSVSQKVALQMNCKLGGELWSVKVPINDLMVCGMDSYHDNASGGGKKSVLAFVASTNQNRTRWYSASAMQKAGQEVGDCLKVLFLNSLKKYYEVNHRLPQKIVLYRDGVGDGQLDLVAKYETEQLTSCFSHFADYQPSLAVVVVQKRINTRMYAADRGGRLSNPPPGTILDHTVTRRKWYDFFLVSQHVRQGTVSPTHYVVVWDSSGLKPEHMQRLAYKMTHLYYNWPGTVRVPAPCQYAHKLAYLVGQSLHKEAHADLHDRLFYL